MPNYEAPLVRGQGQADFNTKLFSGYNIDVERNGVRHGLIG